MNSYRNIVLIHALDDSTAFLSDFKELNPNGYIEVGPEEESISGALEQLRTVQPLSLIIFLGHGYSAGLGCLDVSTYERRTMINAEVANDIFSKHDVLLLSCKSGEFIQRLNTYNSVLGFGNILSSLAEVRVEAEYTGRFRDLSAEDIDYFNRTYVRAIMKSLKLLIDNRILFKMVPQRISYFINKEINLLLRQKNKDNRVEIATLLFEFRNEMVYKVTDV
ncbi:MAG: hypothetical protein ACT6QS_07130 [Flavobacteriales bacterium]